MNDIDPGEWKCERCSAWGNVADGAWRFNGIGFEHKCPDADPQSGHFPAERVTHADLRARLASAEAACAAMREAAMFYRRHASDEDAFEDYERHEATMDAPDAGSALLAELEAARRGVAAVRKLDEDGTPTEEWEAIVKAVEAYDKARKS